MLKTLAILWVLLVSHCFSVDELGTSEPSPVLFGNFLQDTVVVPNLVNLPRSLVYEANTFTTELGDCNAVLITDSMRRSLTLIPVLLGCTTKSQMTGSYHDLLYNSFVSQSQCYFLGRYVATSRYESYLFKVTYEEGRQNFLYMINAQGNKIISAIRLSSKLSSVGLNLNPEDAIDAFEMHSYSIIRRKNFMSDLLLGSFYLDIDAATSTPGPDEDPDDPMQFIIAPNGMIELQ